MLLARKRNRGAALWLLITLAAFAFYSSTFHGSQRQLPHATLPSSTPSDEISTKTTTAPPPPPPRRLKKILYWTGLFASADMYFGYGQEPFIRARCKVTNCIATDDRNQLNDSDALLFHFHKRNFNLSDLPPFRSPRQRYVFFSFESLAHDLEFPFPVD